MNTADRVRGTLFAGALALFLVHPGWGDDRAGSLELLVETPSRTVSLGHALDFVVSLRNSGHEAIELYHPKSIHMVSYCWSLSFRVTRPDGNVVTLAPEITFASAPFVERKDFQRLEPGEALSVPIHLEADDPSATHTPSGWVGLIPISTVEFDVLPEAAVKRLHGIRGDVYFIVGSETSLAIRDLLMDVFNQPGDYRLEFDYHNDCTQHLEFSEAGTGELSSVHGAWSGRLAYELVVRTED